MHVRSGTRARLETEPQSKLHPAHIAADDEVGNARDAVGAGVDRRSRRRPGSRWGRQIRPVHDVVDFPAQLKLLVFRYREALVQGPVSREKIRAAQNVPAGRAEEERTGNLVRRRIEPVIPILSTWHDIRVHAENAIRTKVGDEISALIELVLTRVGEKGQPVSKLVIPENCQPPSM
jgi:hypothetical protein